VRHRFGGFTLDDSTREIVLDEGEIHLSPKAYDLLLVLIENRGRAMSKVELLQQLWPDTYVEETNLAGLVAHLRRVLGDSADEPRFIRTIYGFGYRFIGQVDSNEAADPPRLPARRCSLSVAGRHLPLLEGVSTIGRSADVAIHIDAPGISRRHASITVSGGAATLEDLGSKNGTHLNGRLLTGPSALTDGDHIQFGAVEAIFTTSADPAATETLG
jgi:DNA-binding winged helix-turn-helix (wHTH) protein